MTKKDKNKKSPRPLESKPLSSSPAKSKKGGGVRKEIKAAGPNISKGEMKKITQAAGGNVRKAVNQIAKVQQSQRQADTPTTTLASGAANMLIRQAAKATPQSLGYQPPDFGTSKLGQTLQSMVGTPDLRQRNPQGGFYGGASTATPTQLVRPGEAIRASGRIGPKRKVTPEPMVKETIHSTSGGFPGGRYDNVAGAGAAADTGEAEPAYVQGLRDDLAYLQEMQIANDQRAADLSNVFNTELMRIQQGYADQVALGIQQQQQQEAENRAYMMNQFRMGARPDLRGVQTFNPQLAGTQGFKYRPQASFMAPAQVATAFTTPTSTTTAPVNQVLNI